MGTPRTRFAQVRRTKPRCSPSVKRIVPRGKPGSPRAARGCIPSPAAPTVSVHTGLKPASSTTGAGSQACRPSAPPSGHGLDAVDDRKMNGPGPPPIDDNPRHAITGIVIGSEIDIPRRTLRRRTVSVVAYPDADAPGAFRSARFPQRPPRRWNSQTAEQVFHRERDSGDGVILHLPDADKDIVSSYEWFMSQAGNIYAPAPHGRREYFFPSPRLMVFSNSTFLRRSESPSRPIALGHKIFQGFE